MRCKWSEFYVQTVTRSEIFCKEEIGADQKHCNVTLMVAVIEVRRELWNKQVTKAHSDLFRKNIIIFFLNFFFLYQ